MSALDVAFLATMGAGLVLTLLYVACAVAIEIGLKRAHRTRTGLDLVSPWPVFPLMACMVCGMDVLAPRLAEKRVSYVVTIRRASPLWRRLAAVGALSAWIGIGLGLVGYALSLVR